MQNRPKVESVCKISAESVFKIPARLSLFLAKRQQNIRGFKKEFDKIAASKFNNILLEGEYASTEQALHE